MANQALNFLIRDFIAFKYMNLPKSYSNCIINSQLTFHNTSYYTPQFIYSNLTEEPHKGEVDIAILWRDTRTFLKKPAYPEIICCFNNNRTSNGEKRQYCKSQNALKLLSYYNFSELPVVTGSASLVQTLLSSSRTESDLVCSQKYSFTKSC